jgi:hypothetical protein
MMPRRVLFNWRLRIAYLLLAGGMGVSIALGSGLPVGTTVCLFVAVALLRITLEARQS